MADHREIASGVNCVNDELINVLLVEDNPGDARLMREFLTEAPSARIELVHVALLSEMLQRLAEAQFDVVLLDLSLPDSQGLDTFVSVHKQTTSVPIIVLTGLDDEAFAVQAVKNGAQDYLVKGRVDGNLLVRSIRYAIERQRAEETLRRRNHELALLNRAGQMLSSTLDLDQVLATVLEEVRGLLDVTTVSVWLADPVAKRLVCKQATGAAGEITQGCRLVWGEGLAGWVACNGETLVVPDTQVDNRHFKGVDQKTGLSLRSILGVPLRVKEDVIGVLQVTDTDVDRFGPADLALIEPLAVTAAIAIENARLYRELLNHAELLEERVQERTAQLQAQYARLEAVLRSTADGIIVADGQGEICLANAVVEKWLYQSFSPEDVQRMREAVRDLVLRAAECPACMLELKGCDLELRAALISEQGTERAKAVVAIHDVSHLKALDRMKTRFVSNVSHELRTPVTTILLYATLMQQNPDKWEQYLDTLMREARHQADLVEDILQISQIDAGRLEMELRPTFLNELTEATTVNHQMLAQDRGVTLEHRPAEPGPVALVDSQRMMQVLNNLVENAVRYTIPGGRVTVWTGEERINGRMWATATVTDTGIGIPEEEFPHIFERFFRGNGPREIEATGTGLGLAIIKEVVALHGGRVEVESEVDVGTTFTIWVPLAKLQEQLVCPTEGATYLSLRRIA